MMQGCANPFFIWIVVLSGVLLMGEDSAAQFTNLCDPDPCQSIPNAIPDSCLLIVGSCSAASDYICLCHTWYTWHGATNTCVAVPPSEFPAPVPKTGQTISYLWGDDGGLEKGFAWPDVRFTENDDGTTTDNLTGLIWTTNANCGGMKTWGNALIYCNALADGTCGLSDASIAGDWRLANIRELHSLIDYGNNAPSLPAGHPFTNLGDRYSSSTTSVADPLYSWDVEISWGGVNMEHRKDILKNAWCVRGEGTGHPAPVPKTGQTLCYNSVSPWTTCTCGTTGCPPGQDGDLEQGVAWPAPRFTDNSDGTATDNLTGLVWTTNANCEGAKSWGDAVRYCNTLEDGRCGLSDASIAGDWRLANVREISRLIDCGNLAPALPTGHPFTNVKDRYWSSTTNDGNTARAYDVGIGGRIVHSTEKGTPNYAWCVRDGQQQEE